MFSAATRALFWKEWRETRWKFLAFWTAFHLPLGIMGFALLIRQKNRFTLQTIPPKILYQGWEGIVFIESIFIITLGLALIAFFAAGTVSRELRGRQIFFLLERPVSRSRVLSVKYLVSGLQAYVMAALTPSTALAVAAIASLLFSRTTDWGDGMAHLGPILESALRIGFWRATMVLMVFSIVFLFSVTFESQWASMGAGLASLVVIFYFFFEDLLGSIFLPAAQQRGRGFSLSRFGEIEGRTVLVLLIVAIACYFVAQSFFARKEIT